MTIISEKFYLSQEMINLEFSSLFNQIQCRYENYIQIKFSAYRIGYFSKL